MSDLTCPYCGHEQEVCHDDGFGYAEDVRHEDECEECGKAFVFNTTIVFYYEAKKADCLNGADHKWKLSNTIPRQFSRWQCEDCDAEKMLTPEERASLEVEDNKFEEQP